MFGEDVTIVITQSIKLTFLGLNCSITFEPVKGSGSLVSFLLVVIYYLREMMVGYCNLCIKLYLSDLCGYWYCSSFV